METATNKNGTTHKKMHTGTHFQTVILTDIIILFCAMTANLSQYEDNHVLAFTPISLIARQKSEHKTPSPLLHITDQGE